MDTEKDKKNTTETQLNAHYYQAIISNLGENPEREGLLKTPMRAAKAMAFLTQGYKQNAADILKSALFTQDYKEMVLVENIDFFSLCEHHLLPFFGKAHIAYIPNGQIVGLSKIPRLVDVFARRLQVQENMTTQIMQTMQDVLQAKGVAVQLEAQHLCMQMRGVQKTQSYTVTQAFSGIFLENLEFQKKFVSLLKK